MTRLADDQVPRLLRGVRVRYDAVRDCHVLLAPERVLKLDATGAAVLAATDGRRSFAQVVEALAADYAAPPEIIAADARRFLEALIDRRMVEASW